MNRRVGLCSLGLWFSTFKGLKERPLKRPLELYRGCMGLYKGYIGKKDQGSLPGLPPIVP